MFRCSLAGVRSLDLAPELASHLISAQRLEEQERRGHRGSGLPELDALLTGGWPRAALSELVGRRSSGRTSVLFASLARAGAAGEATALVDTAGALDPRAAAACGIALPRLLWIRCTAEQALKATDLIIGAGGFDVVALDLGDARPRVPTASWVRLKHAAEKQGTSVLIATSARAVGAFAAAAIELTGAAPHFVPDGPPLLGGLRAKVERGRGGRTPETGEDGRCAWLAFSCRS
jgi:RecA/RadA recombinase